MNIIKKMFIGFLTFVYAYIFVKLQNEKSVIIFSIAKVRVRGS